MNSPVTVLVVDDDVLIAMTCADMITELGFRAVEANSGSQALELLNSEARIDLLVTDFSMPGMDGMELARSAREKVPGLPVIIATGYAELPADSDLDLRRIGKPYTQNDLAAAIASSLNIAID
jgi:CheY-like chemotaxis protein